MTRRNLVLDLPVLHHAIQRPIANAEQARRLVAVVLGQFQSPLDEVTLDFVQRTADEAAEAGDGTVGGVETPQRVAFLNVVQVESAIGVLDNHAVDGVAQLTYVALPIVNGHGATHRIGDATRHLLAVPVRKILSGIAAPGARCPRAAPARGVA